MKGEISHHLTALEANQSLLATLTNDLERTKHMCSRAQAEKESVKQELTKALQDIDGMQVLLGRVVASSTNLTVCFFCVFFSVLFSFEEYCC